MNRLTKALKNPYWAFGVLVRKGFSKFLSDRTFIKLEYFSGMKEMPNLEHPTTYNEKLQWLKLNDIHPEYTQYVDKYLVKDYIIKKLGYEYVFPTLQVWDRVEDIDFDKLPNQFVLKTTHDSGGVVICRDKATFNKASAIKKLRKSYNTNYFYEHREYPYKNITPRIIAEPLMVDESGYELKDYKFFVFNGKCKMLFVGTDRQTDLCFDFFDEKFNHLPFVQGHPWAKKPIKKPENFDKMIEIAEKLGSDFHHVRVDLYDVNGKIFFGELTFFHFSGNVPFEPQEWDQTVGEWLNLPIK
jgi:hypothetical protein